MYNNRQSRSHPLTQQVPLTVSPFIPLPTPPTLSYNYKHMPSTLPPSQTGIGANDSSSDPQQQHQQQQRPQQASSSSADNNPKYIISPSGQSAHPTDIIASCRQLQAHLAKMQEDAERDLREFDERIRQRELAEKRRVAPGWLDTAERLLVPQRGGGSGGGDDGGGGTPALQPGGVVMGGEESTDGRSEMPGDDAVSEMADEGVELDRAFGGLSVGK